MKKNTTIKMLMIVLMLLAVALYFIAGTYARYTDTFEGSGTAKVAKWAVSVKAKSGDTVKDDLTLTFNEVKNDNVVDGYIAPTSELYADFVIDPTDSQVAVDYSFELGEITSASGTVPTGLAVEKVCTVDSSKNETELTATDGKYTGTINLVDQTKALTSAEAVTVRVYLKWTSPTDSTTQDSADTDAGKTAVQDLTMTVKATAQQHIG